MVGSGDNVVAEMVRSMDYATVRLEVALQLLAKQAEKNTEVVGLLEAALKKLKRE